MWYEQFYSGLITFGFTVATLTVSGATNYIDIGRLYRRDLSGADR